MSIVRNSHFALPLQVAAICYRRRAGAIEFLLVNTNGGSKWTFPKGVFWQNSGVQEYVVKAFLMEVHDTETPEETQRNPTWFSADEARKILAKGREVKYANELRAVIDRALEHIRPEKTPTKYDSRAAARPALPS